MEQSEIDALVAERLQRQKKKHDETMSGRAKEIELLEAKVNQLTEKSSGLSTMEEELTTLRSRVQRSDRLEVMRSNGIPAEAIDDIAAIYQSRMSALPEEDRQDWPTFLGEEGIARSNVLLSQYFTQSDTAGVGVASENPGDAVSALSARPSSSGLPSGNSGVTPLTQGQEKMSPVDLARYFNSSEYRSLPSDQQKVKLQELKGTHRRK